MATPSTSFRITQVSPPRVGEQHPASVQAEVVIDTRSMRGDVASGWDELKQHDVLFLLGGEVAGVRWGVCTSQAALSFIACLYAHVCLACRSFGVTMQPLWTCCSDVLGLCSDFMRCNWIFLGNQTSSQTAGAMKNSIADNLCVVLLPACSQPTQ